jgi:hypothetical protein
MTTAQAFLRSLDGANIHFQTDDFINDSGRRTARAGAVTMVFQKHPTEILLRS